jgi:AcrR family transcriptional regulator
MPPRIKITKDDIIEKTLDLIRVGGEAAINTRSIAAALNCSTQPIFSNFSSMEELYEAVTCRAHERYLKFLQAEAESGKYPKYKAFGMAYIRFAKEERELFKFLFMRDRKGEDLISTSDMRESADLIVESTGMSLQEAELLHFEMWTCVHGIATMIATSFLDFEWEQISNMVSDVYQGLKARHLEKR